MRTLPKHRHGLLAAVTAAFMLPELFELQTLDSINVQDSSLALMFKTSSANGRAGLLEGVKAGKLDQYAGQQEGKDRFMLVVGEYVKK